MDITWHGHSCFTIKGKTGTIVTDPFELGARLPKLKGEIVTLSKEGKTAEVDGNPKVLDWPGEFEASGVSIEALSPHGDGGNVFIFVVDGIKICHLGFLSAEMSDETLEQIGDVDVLLIPVGGSGVLDGKTAQKVLESVEPRVVIPMLYGATESELQLNGVEEFLKAIGKTELTSVEKYSLSGRSALPEGVMAFALLEPKLG